MFRAAIAAVTFALLTAGAQAGDAAADRAEFADYVATCTAADGPDAAAISACISDQVSALENYLGDILVETEGIVGDGHVEALNAAQSAWESFRDKACAYEAAIGSGHTERRAQFCRLRLVEARIDEILEGEDFADADAGE
jgi:uncharacterized protein YecT (DUF1311 family)